MDELVRRVSSALARYTPVKEGDPIVAACSGGPDSMALLFLLNEISLHLLPLKLYCAHFNHKLRKNEARRDELIVKKAASALNLPFICSSYDVYSGSRRLKLTIQEAARRYRYDFLEDTRRKLNASWIATAHTADDQIEEIILRLIRGASLAGMSGIPIRNENIIRPLLSFQKDELIAYLNRNEIQYAIDSSNASKKYLRNVIRADIAPLLKSLNPSISKAVFKMAMALKDDDNFIYSLAKRAFNDAIIKEKGDKASVGITATNGSKRICLLARRILMEDIAIRRRIYKIAIKTLIPSAMREIRFEHIEAIDMILNGNKGASKLNLHRGIVVEKIYGKLIFSLIMGGIRERRDRPKLFEPINVYGPGECFLSDLCGAVNISEADKGLFKGKSQRELRAFFKTNLKNKLSPVDKKRVITPIAEALRPLYINGDRVEFPLLIRQRENGDRFWPIGGVSPYKLKDFFINRKIPRHIRDMIPIIINRDGDIICVCGIETSERFKIAPNAKWPIRIDWIPSENIKL